MFINLDLEQYFAPDLPLKISKHDWKKLILTKLNNIWYKKYASYLQSYNKLTYLVAMQNNLLPIDKNKLYKCSILKCINDWCVRVNNIKFHIPQKYK